MTLAGMTPEPMWRLLVPEKETIQEGDEVAGWQVFDQGIFLEWTVANPAYFGVAADHHAPVRRRIEDLTAPLRAELRSGYGLLWRLFCAVSHVIRSDERREINEWLARNAGFGQQNGGGE